MQNLAPCQLKHRQVKLPRHDIQYAYKIVSLSPPDCCKSEIDRTPGKRDVLVEREQRGI